MPSAPFQKEPSLGKTFEDFRLKKPSLNLEHINDIGELSVKYLKAEGAEYSEDNLVANLYALFALSKENKMASEHAVRIQKIMLSTLEFEAKHKKK